jgi:MED6 mediator sub complex component
MMLLHSCLAFASAQVQGVYYIMDGTIYQSPSALALIQSRLHKIAFLLGDAFKHLAKLPELNARGSYDWAWNCEAVALYEAQQREAERTDRAAARNEPRLAVDSLLLQLVDKYTTDAPKPQQAP